MSLPCWSCRRTARSDGHGRDTGKISLILSIVRSRALLKLFIIESLDEDVVSPSTDYLHKEDVRKELQKLIVSRVASGNVSNQDELNELVSTLDMALKALKMVPFKAYQSIIKSGR